MKKFFLILLWTAQIATAQKVKVLDCERNEFVDDGTGASRDNLNFNPLKPFTTCARIQFKKLRINNVFVYIMDPEKRPPLEIQVNVFELRIVVAWEYKMVFLKNRLRPFQWYHICVSFVPKENNTIKVYLDGDLIHETGLKLMAESQGYNISIGYKEPWRFRELAFIGNVTQFNIWDTSLEDGIIKDIATCKINPTGSYIGWDDPEWIYHKATIHEVDLLELCDSNTGIGHTVFSKETFSQAAFVCEGIGGRLVSPDSLEVSSTIYKWARNQKNQYQCTSYWAGFFDEISEGTWVHHLNRSLATGIPWGIDEPNGQEYENCAALNQNGLSDDDCKLSKCFICEMSFSESWLMYGSCEEISHNRNFFLEFHDSNWVFRGYGNYIIRRDSKTQTWKWENLATNETIATLISVLSKYPIGRQKWVLHQPMCGRNLTHKTLLLSTCNPDEFSCNDATCVPYEARCDFHPDCHDKSDEAGCQLFHLPTDYKADITPRSTSDSSVLPISAKVDLESLRVETNAMILQITFNLSVEWKEGRVIYYNLKDDLTINIIDASRKQFWVPSIVFMNTKNQGLTVEDNLNQIRVLRKKKSHLTDPSLPEDVIIYSGAVNPLVSYRKYQTGFTCDFDLREYPFDEQTCYMDLRQRSGTAQSLQFNESSSTVKYSGSHNLMEYEIGDVSLTTYIKDGYSGIKVKIPLKRQQGYAFINIYLPSSTMLITGYLTLFFKQDVFEVRMMAGLTSLLVVATLFTETTSSLPKTSYFKLVDAWLLFCIFTTFLVLVFHIIIDSRFKRPTTGTYEKQRRTLCRELVQKLFIHLPESPEKVERIGRILIACVIGTFNVIYWASVYLF